MLYFASADLEQQISHISTNTVIVATVLLVVLTLVSMLASKWLSKRQFKRLKLPLFVGLAASVVIPTFILAFNTIYLNVKAESKGPVHWHSDIEFWACGSEIELRDPTGLLSNKIGTSTYHEHNDKRIHLEGVVVSKKRDASLGKFMEVTGGYINDLGVGIPLNEDQDEWLASANHQDGDHSNPAFQNSMSQYIGHTPKGPVLELSNGTAACGEHETAKAQVFVYSYNESAKTYRQTKLADPAAYVMRDESVIPPGDCVIVEFDKPKDSTDKICLQYGLRDTKRCQDFGVKKYDPELCNIRYEGNH